MVDIKKLFGNLQNEMIAKLNKGKVIVHAPTQGDATELNWLEWLETYLPKRYSVCSGFVVDHKGTSSDQIDIIIYDKQYSPLVFEAGGKKYVTAESIFAVFEVKPTLNKEYLEYAGNKAASVRKLIRTSAPIVYSTGIKDPKTPHRIIAGLLTTENNWKNKQSLVGNLQSLRKEQELDIICAISDIACRVTYDRDDKKHSEIANITLDKNADDGILIFLFLTILLKLQAIGTVPAIEFDKYFGGVPTIEEVFADMKKASEG